MERGPGGTSGRISASPGGLEGHAVVGPISFPGLFSGIDYNSIIEALLAAQQGPLLTLQGRINDATDKKTALLSVSAKLLGIRSSVTALQKPSFLNRTIATSSNTNVLTASGDAIGVTGAFTFAVERLAQSHQLISNGFADDDDVITAAAASITVEVGNGFLERGTPLAFLNGGEGVDRGFIQVTDGAGATAVIDLQGALTVQDVLDRLNNNTAINVEATARADRIVVSNVSQIQDFGLDSTATDLGLAKAAVIVGGTSFIFGDDVNFVTTQTDLRFLNDGLGVRRNGDGVTDFTIVTASGAAVAVDLQANDLTLGDAVGAINAAAAAIGSTLTASVNEDGTGLKIATDGGAGAAFVSAGAGSLAAADLGLGYVSGLSFFSVSARDAATGAASPTGALFFGNRVLGGLNSIMRRTLNGGQEATSAADLQGVRDGSITITDRQGDSITVNVDRQTFVTLAAGAAAGAASATLASVDGFAVGNKVRFAGGLVGGDTTTRTITRISGTTILFDTALDVAYDAGDSAYGLNESLGDIVNNLNYRTGSSAVGVAFRINDIGNGILVRDTSGGAGTLAVSGGGTLAAGDLGISGTAASTKIDGADLDPQYIGANVLLSTLNGGKGVQAGKFRVTDTNGTAFDVDLTQPDDVNIREVINDFNGAAIGAGSDVRARVNDTGDGILLSSAAPGAGTLTVSELGATTTARDLNILGAAPSASPDRIDGSFERTVTIAAGTRVKDVANLLNAANVGIQASLLNDGGAINPFKLSVLSKTAGARGRVVIDSDIAGLNFTTTTAAQDSVLLYGVDGGATDPLLITGNSNTVKDIVPGLTLNLKSVSASPVTVTIDKDQQAVLDQVQMFVDAYNEAIDEIRDLTKFDADTNATGILFTESSIRTVRRDLANLVTSPVNQIPAGDIRSFREIGVKVVTDGKLAFDSSTLQSALDANFDEVVEFFTSQLPLKVDTPLDDLNNGLGVGTIDGQEDFRVIKRNGSFFDVNLDGVTTLGSVLNLINNDPGNGGEIVASIASDGFSIQITDGSPLGRLADAGGSTTTLVESDLIGSPVDFVGARVLITGGPDAGQTRFVTAFSSASGTLTLDAALSVAPDGFAYDFDRALQVQVQNDSSAAADLRINAKLELGENVLAGNLINLSGDPGKGFSIAERLDFLTRAGDGLISTRTDGIDDKIDGYNDSIDRLEKKLEKQRELLVKQFASLEQQIASSQQIMSQLQAQQSSLLSLAGGGGL